MSTALSTPVHPRRPRGLLNIIDFRHRSLLRANLLMLLSMIAAVYLSHFPNDHATPLLAIPTIVALYATFETVRCMQRRWSFYHAGVILCIYMDMMATATILFLLVYPYTHLLSASS
jgi:hypothetical protein